MGLSLQQVADHEEIRQALNIYIRATDRCDSTLLADVWWEDGVFEGGPFAEPVLQKLPKFLESPFKDFYTTTSHYLSNMVIQMRADRASVEAYALAYHLIPADPKILRAVLGDDRFAAMQNAAHKPYELLMGVRYCTRMQRRAGVWKISTLRIIIDWSQVQPYSGISTGSVYEMLQLRGSKDATDPSYAVFA
jgi:hypothetical protein